MYLLENPVLQRELLVNLRTARAFVLLFGYNAVLGLVVMDHGNGVFSHVQSGFNYFNPHGHEGSKETRHTITIVGTQGSMGLVGYDWEPLGVDLATQDQPTYQRFVAERHDYVWQQGASLAAETLATGKEWLFAPEHALHVVEIICAARESQETGRRIELKSTFKWPVIS